MISLISFRVAMLATRKEIEGLRRRLPAGGAESHVMRTL